jgi:hypothetical protein
VGFQVQLSEDAMFNLFNFVSMFFFRVGSFRVIPGHAAVTVPDLFRSSTGLADPGAGLLAPGCSESA